MTSRKADFWYWVVTLLPKNLVYFCFMHVFAYSTTGKYGNTLTTELTALDAIKRYGNDKGCGR